MGLNIDYIEGQTPLDEDEKEGLLIDTISTRGELDEFEQANIQQAVEWSIINKFDADQILSEDFIRELHDKMFGEVWEWAGEYRRSNKYIGVDKHQIAVALRQLIDDSKFWIEKEIYGFDEIAIRFSHQVVKIHAFPNGNGRHSRLIADIIISHIFDFPVFTWGSANLSKTGDVRKEYLNAIYDADAGDINALLAFSRK